MRTQHSTSLVVCLAICIFAATGVTACGDMEEPNSQNQTNQQQNGDTSNDQNNTSNDGNDTSNGDNDTSNDGNDTSNGGNDTSNNQTQNGDDVDPSEHDIEIAGVWDTEFDDVVTITDEEWTSQEWTSRDVESFDNDEKRVIVQTPEDAETGAGTYSRIVWTGFDGDTFHYCEDAFQKDTAEEARNAESNADSGDLATGCGDGNSWTEMTRQDQSGDDVDPSEHDIEIAGVWDTEFDDVVTITDEQWASQEWTSRDVESFDNDEKRVIVQTPEDAETAAGTFSRIVWTGFDGDSFHYCEDVFQKDTAEEARNAESNADSGDLASGCGEGNSWSEMTRQ